MLRLTIDKEGKVWSQQGLATDVGGYTFKCVCIGASPQQAIDRFWDEEMSGVPTDLVDPKILSIRRLFPERDGWAWEFEVYVNGEAEWMEERKDLDPESLHFVQWVQKYGHDVTDMREKEAAT